MEFEDFFLPISSDKFFCFTQLIGNLNLQVIIQARKRLMDILEKNISERRGGIATSRVDFLQQLLAVDDDKLNKDEVPRLTDRQITDNILTMMIAGKD